MKIDRKTDLKELSSDGSKGSDPYDVLGNAGAELKEADENMRVMNKDKEFTTTYKDGGNPKGAKRKG
jgi:hypothetical protein